MISDAHISIDRSRIAEYCRRWSIVDLALFGSVLRSDFGPDSDVDVMVAFAPGSRWGLLDFSRMEDELAAILGRRVDLVERSAIERSDNYIRRRAILDSLEPVYGAG